MKYITYLKNKNLSKNTIKTYLNQKINWETYLEGKKPTKKLFVNYIKKHTNNFSPNTTKLVYSSVLSFLKFQKNWKLYNDCKDIRMPSIVLEYKITINLKEYNECKNSIILSSWYEQRNWLIFSFLFYTGIRVSELRQINKKNIIDNQIKIQGKGSKTRNIYIFEYLEFLLKNWRSNKININKRNKQITEKQVNLIIKKIGEDYFNKKITPHSLRRSYGTNLLREEVDIKTVSVLLGHSNINTTSRYIHFTDDEIKNKIRSVF